MAMINCPECGRTISDKAIKCPQCGYPLRADISQQPQVKKSMNKKIFVIVFGVVLLLLAVGWLISTRKTGKAVEELKFDKWKMTDPGKSYDKYEAELISSTKRPFIGVIGSYTDEDAKPQFVYMEDGKGTLQLYYSSEKDPSIEYKPIGYIYGEKLKESDIKSITCEPTEYNDYGDYYTDCFVDINVELKSKKTGLLFIEVKNDTTKEVDYNCAINIIDGKGDYTYYLTDLPLKYRGVKVTAAPKYFCDAKRVKDSDYEIEKKYSVEKSEYSESYSGEEELKFNDFEDGYILYTELLESGGNKESRGEKNNRITYLLNERCQISTYDTAKDEKILAPEYQFDIVGYITWSKLTDKENAV